MSVADGLCLDISGVTVRFGRLPPAGLRLRVDWARFVTGEAPAPFLDVQILAHDSRDDPAPFTAKGADLLLEDGLVSVSMAEGSSEAALDGPVRIELAPTSADKQYYALQNLLLAALAWRLPSRGGAVVHAAGIVIEGRAFLLVGPEGAGKTTWALLARSAGAEVLSDDVVLVDREGAGYVALGSPFRAAEHGTLGRGRWPVAALLHPRHAGSASLSRVEDLAAHARIAANLPYAGELYGRDPRIERVVDDLVAAVPSLELAFQRDASFVALLRDLASDRPERGSVQ